MTRATASSRSIRGSRLLAAALAALVLGAPALSRAGEDKSVETARAVFVEAAKLAGQGRWAEARERYLLSLRLRRAAITLYSVGVVEKEMGLLPEARLSFRAFLDEPSTPETKVYEEPARKAIAEIDVQTGKPAATADTSPPERPRADPSPVLAFSLIGVGSALFAGGLGTGIAGIVQADHASSGAGSDASSARAKGIVGDVLATTGVAAASVGVILLIVQRNPSPPKTASVRPWISGSTAGVSIYF